MNRVDVFKLDIMEPSRVMWDGVWRRSQMDVIGSTVSQLPKWGSIKAYLKLMTCYRVTKKNVTRQILSKVILVKMGRPARKRYRVINMNVTRLM